MFLGLDHAAQILIYRRGSLYRLYGMVTVNPSLPESSLLSGGWNQDYVKRGQKQYLICRICREPLQLGPGTVTDADGQSVYECCQVTHIITTGKLSPRNVAG